MGYYLPNKSYLKPSLKANTSQKLLAITTGCLMLTAFGVIFTSLQFGDSETAMAEMKLQNHAPDYVTPASPALIPNAIPDEANPANENMPVELAYFSATEDINSVNLKWLSISEYNNEYYTIEKSKKGSPFTEVAIVNAGDQNNHSSTYTYVDKEQGEGLIFYRLKQTSNNGKSSYVALDKIIKNSYTAEQPLFIDDVGPQPFDKYFNINYFSVREGGISVELFDSNGKNIYKTYTTAKRGYNTCRFIDGEHLLGQEYSLRIANSSGVHIKKIKRRI